MKNDDNKNSAYFSPYTPQDVPAGKAVADTSGKNDDVPGHIYY
jgi:hypothetical protein